MSRWRMAIEVLPGYIKLLVAIFHVEETDALWVRWGVLPPGKMQCLGCGTLIWKWGVVHLCPKCEEERHYVTLRCGQCQKEFKLRRSDYNGRLRERKLSLFFCGRRCYGRYIGLNYGFAAHPGHAGGRRKWDYSKVFSLWEETRWSQRRVSEALGIPAPSIASILMQYPAYVNRRALLGG